MLFMVSKSPPTMSTTIKSTMTKPASVAMVAISSLPLFFKITLTTAVKRPIPAILKIMPIPKAHLLSDDNHQRDSKQCHKLEIHAAQPLRFLFPFFERVEKIAFKVF